MSEKNFQYGIVFKGINGRNRNVHAMHKESVSNIKSILKIAKELTPEEIKSLNKLL